MFKFNARKQWWIVIAAISVITTAFYLIAEQWFPSLQPLSAFLTMGLLGVGFCWVYALDRESHWWAIIPGLALLIFMTLSLAAFLIGVEQKDEWMNVLALGVGAAIIGAVLKRKPAKRTLFIIALIIFLVGILMSPIAILLKVLLIVVDVLTLGYFVWRNRT
jgi:nicotinamide riboside transporter PnuC